MQDIVKDLILAGVKWELCDNSVGVLSDLESVRAPARTRLSSVVPPISPVSAIDIDTANAMAMRPTTLDSLCRMISEFNHPLRGGITNVVLPMVAPNPNGLMIITDMPSSDDDALGRILTGAPGELLDKMLNAIDMSRETVSISPILFWRTPGGRTPSRLELDLSRPFLNRFIELIEPRIVLTLGTLAAAEICNVDLMHNHGAETTTASGARAFSIYHPNYLMLKPNAKADVWSVLKSVQNLLKNS